MLRSWARVGTKFFPFADAASPTLPLSRLLRLSLFQISVGMALALTIVTLRPLLRPDTRRGDLGNNRPA